MSAQRTKPKRRKFTWVILVINALFLLWVISGAASSSHNCSGLLQDDQTACQAGTAIGVGILIVFWAVVDVILGVIWLVTNRRG